MATKIQGITIQLGADSHPLETALKSINVSLGQTQKELVQVEKLLKLDPKNVELLTQKQKLLEQQLMSTREKYSKLNLIMRELEQQRFGGADVENQIRAVERELIKTSQTMQKLQTDFKDTNKSVDNIGDGFSVASAKSVTFKDKLHLAGEKVNDLDTKVNGKLTKSIEGMGAAAVIAGGLAIKSFVEFGNEAVKVKTLIDESVMSYDESKSMILDLSDATGRGAAGMADATYQALSAGVATADLSVFMADSAKLAVASFSDEAAVVDILTSTLNAYNLKTTDAAYVSDLLTVTQERGKITVEEMANGMGKLIGLTASANIPLEDVTTAIATLTANGLPASTAMSSLTQVVSGIIKPTEEAKKAAQSMGLSFNANSLASKGLSGMLEDIQRKTRGSTEKAAELFGSVEALNDVLILTSDSGSKHFTETLGAMNNSLGKTDDQYKKVSEESGFKLQQSFNSLKNSLIEVGDTLTPLIELIAGVFNIIAKINPGTLAFIGTLVIVATVILQIVKAFGALSKMGGAIGSFFGGINPQAMKTTVIIMMVVAAVILLIAAICALFGKADDLGSAFSSAGDAVGKVTGQVNSTQQGFNPPQYATGTNYHKGGGAYITEYGPEQLQLPNGANYVVMPRGTKVNPTATTAALMQSTRAGAGDIFNITIDASSVKEFSDIVKIAQGTKQARRAR